MSDCLIDWSTSTMLARWISCAITPELLVECPSRHRHPHSRQ